MKLSRAVLDVMRGATGAAMVMSVGCSSMGQAAPPPPPPASHLAQTPVRTAPVVLQPLQPLPPLPRGADVPGDLVPLAPGEPTASEPPPHPQQVEQVASPLPRVNQTISQPSSTTQPGDVEPTADDLELGSIGMPDSVAAACGRG